MAKKNKKFAYLPTLVKLSGRSVIIWMQSYWVQESDKLPVLCECKVYPCKHNKRLKKYFKFPAKRPGILSIWL